ncbi:hypothetical protein GCM10011588_53320 [Nocardia jinanensis]|uniref:Uncharacterized protein n=3 Tax=Nocardia jinanensis TaxID=382504 RepID=A0A917RU66_9NOCA|nr:hypothetical protein GCM10011588_53320 [Nocardia jinanensis]
MTLRHRVIGGSIISGMLGFPDSDREMFLRWGDDISPLLDLGISWRTHQRAMESSERVHRYLAEHIERLRAEPELWPNAVEEILRIDPPVQSTARICG